MKFSAEEISSDTSMFLTEKIERKHPVIVKSLSWHSCELLLPKASSQRDTFGASGHFNMPNKFEHRSLTYCPRDSFGGNIALCSQNYTPYVVKTFKAVKLCLIAFLFKISDSYI